MEWDYIFLADSMCLSLTTDRQITRGCISGFYKPRPNSRFLKRETFKNPDFRLSHRKLLPFSRISCV